MTPLELLAPARNADIGIAAIACGADAVYIGGPAFGARAAATNSVQDIKRLCDYASKFGARIYVTVNTLCSDQEKGKLVEMILSLRGTGVSAFIIQDASLLALLAPYGPWEEAFHASTQCAIRTPERARELVDAGFSRLILERELSLSQIKAIREAVPETEIECFVHGALCVCYSGDCYLSEFLTGRSANRGECAQPCRAMYDLADSEGKILVRNKPLLSLKDFHLLDKLPELAASGVCSFKIEGRLKNEAYVKNVVRAYSIALDSLVEKSGGKYCRASFGHCSGGFIPDLNKTFNRGYTSLFIDGQRGSWHSEDAAKSMGEAIGEVISIKGSSCFCLKPYSHETLIHNADGLCHIGRNSLANGFRADVVRKNPDCTYEIQCKSTENLHKGDKIWRNLDSSFEKEIITNPPQRLIDIRLDWDFTHNGQLVARAEREDGLRLEQNFDVSDCPQANNTQRMEQMLTEASGKAGGNCRFRPGQIIYEGGLPLMKAAFLNSVRRSFAEMSDASPIRSLTIRHTDTSTLKALNGHPRKEGELMRTKYCIRYRLGLCPKQSGTHCTDLFLLNNGRKLSLHFDCTHCEMVVSE